MKKVVLVISLAFLLLVSCEKSNIGIDEVEVPQNDFETEVEIDSFKTLEIDAAKFHFVVGWLGESEIVYVEKEDSIYFLRKFNVNTGEVETLYQESMIIIDAKIHPTKERILLHTSNDSSSATVKILSLEGVVLDEVSIASSELEIEWNVEDPKLILLTAFYQDWTYDVILYNGNEKELSTIPLEDPFPKWLGQQIITVHIPEHPLDGGILEKYNFDSKLSEPLMYENVVHFETNGDSLVIVQIVDENAEYKLVDNQGEIADSWRLPVVSNYSEWIFPEIAWIDDETLMTLATTDGGELDNLKEPFMLVKLQKGEQVMVNDDFNLTPLLCSPSGEKCLIGNSSEKLLDIQKQVEFTWLLLKDY